MVNSSVAEHQAMLSQRYYARLQRRLRLKYRTSTPRELAMLELYRQECNPKHERNESK